jgi:hypothetical protein
MDRYDQVDTPAHCATCEDLLPQQLTEAGLEYAWEKTLEYILHDSGRGCILRQWWEEWGAEIKEHMFPEDTEPITRTRSTACRPCHASGTRSRHPLARSESWIGP